MVVYLLCPCTVGVFYRVWELLGDVEAGGYSRRSQQFEKLFSALHHTDQGSGFDVSFWI